MGFDRKEDFNSRKIGSRTEPQRGVGNKTECHTTVLQWLGPHTARRMVVRLGTAVSAPSSARPAFFQLFICLISYFWGDFSDFFRAFLGRISV